MHKKLNKIIKKFGLSSQYIATATELKTQTIKEMRSDKGRLNFKDRHYKKLLINFKKDVSNLK